MAVISTDEVRVAHAEEVLFQVFVRLCCIFYVNIADVAREALLIEEEYINVLTVVYG